MPAPHNTIFKIGHINEIDVEENSIDVVILRMVLQWVPRGKIFATISEIDKILKPGGVVWIEDFLGNRPITSQSRHNKDVYIFKEDHSKYFTCSPRYNEIYRLVERIIDGEDQQRCNSIIMKYDIRDVYLRKKGAIAQST